MAAGLVELSDFSEKGSRTLLGFTPVKVAAIDDDNEMADDIPAPYISTCGHYGLVALYFLLCAAYLGYAVYEYIERPEVENYSQVPASRFEPPEITLYVQCFHNPNCGNITLIQNFTRDTGCMTSISDITHSTLTAPLPPVRLCYVDEDGEMSTNTGELLRTPGLSIDFSAISSGERNTSKAYGTVLVEVKHKGEDQKPMRKIVNMDTWQVKTFYIGMSVHVRNGVIQSTSFYAQNLQYDGKRSSWRATYIIRLAQFANVYDVSRPGSWVDILAQLGGAATIVAAALLMMECVWMRLCPGGERALPRGRMALYRKQHRKDASDRVFEMGTSGPGTTTPQPHQPGDKVLVLYDKEWLPAEVLAPTNKGYSVRWSDGTSSVDIPTDMIRTPPRKETK